MKANEKNIRHILAKWRPRLGLDDRWSIEVRLYTDDNWSKKKKDAVAYIEPNPGYFTATMHINTDAVARDGHSLTHIVLHELVHLPAWSLSLIARDALGEDQEPLWRMHMEQLVETITRALLSR